jgi:hypothetical protein
VRSAENADLASGYANVVVLSPFGGPNRTPPERGADPEQWFTLARRCDGAAGDDLQDGQPVSR